MEKRNEDEVRGKVRTAYAKVARGASGCGVGCCGTEGVGSMAVGYSPEEIASAPEGADLGLGCGNPQAIAELRAGETVLDLGSGAGFDCFLAARRVAPGGRVIGVDMTPEMVEKARDNAVKANEPHVEFRLGEIEHLPVADASVDVILSNCVINLAPDKRRVFREAFRVLRPGGRLAISDVVALGAMPEALAASLEALTGCVAGAASVAELRGYLVESGFEDVRIVTRPETAAIIGQCMPGAEGYAVSAVIEGRKPSAAVEGKTEGSCCAPLCCS